MKIINLRSWADFDDAIQDVEEIRRSKAADNEREFLQPMFRGLGNSDWFLRTTLERASELELDVPIEDLAAYYAFTLSAKPAIETVAAEEWPDMPGPTEFSKELTKETSFGAPRFFARQVHIYRYLVYLRHHGFPSPLLDWTASPYIAAFFAFDAMDRSAASVSLIAIVRDSMSAGDLGRPQIFLLGPYVRAHRRHIVQQSRYTICMRWKDTFKLQSHDDVIEKRGALGIAGEAVRINLPAAERTRALRSLDLMNINAYSLLGSDDSLVRTIARREGLFRN